MNKTLKRWAESGDRRFEKPFNEFFRAKRSGQFVVFSGWLNQARKERFQTRRVFALNRWLKSPAKPSFPPCRSIDTAIPSVAFEMIKFKERGGKL